MASAEYLPALHWPSYWTAPNPLQRFLLGVPVVGLQARVRDGFERQLRSRGPGWDERWTNVDCDPDTRRTVSAVIQRWFEWPNDHFIPEDTFGILIWDWRAYFIDDLTVSSAVEELETQLGLPRLSDEEWEDLLPLPFDEVLGRLWRRTQR